MEDISDNVSKEYTREIKDYDDFIQNVAFYKSDKKSPELAPKEYINRYKFVKNIKLPKIDLSFNNDGGLNMFHTDKYINNVNFFTKHVLPYISKKEFCYFYSMLVSKLLPNGLPKDFNYTDFLGITVILYYFEFGDIYIEETKKQKMNLIEDTIINTYYNKSCMINKPQYDYYWLYNSYKSEYQKIYSRYFNKESNIKHFFLLSGVYNCFFLKKAWFLNLQIINNNQKPSSYSTDFSKYYKPFRHNYLYKINYVSFIKKIFIYDNENELPYYIDNNDTDTDKKTKLDIIVEAYNNVVSIKKTLLECLNYCISLYNDSFMNNNCTRNSIKKCLYNDENDNTMFIHKKNRYDVFSSLINNVCFFIKISSNIYFSDFINYIVDIFIDKYKDKDVTISKQDVQDFTNTYYGIKNILNNISQQLGIKYGLEELFTNVINILSVSKCDIKEFINEHNNESSNNKKYHLLNSFLLYLFTDFYTDLKTIYANTETLLKDYCVKNTVIFRFSKMAQNINKFQKDIQAYKLAKKKKLTN